MHIEHVIIEEVDYIVKQKCSLEITTKNNVSEKDKRNIVRLALLKHLQLSPDSYVIRDYSSYTLSDFSAFGIIHLVNKEVILQKVLKDLNDLRETEETEETEDLPELEPETRTIAVEESSSELSESYDECLNCTHYTECDDCAETRQNDHEKSNCNIPKTTYTTYTVKINDDKGKEEEQNRIETKATIEVAKNPKNAQNAQNTPNAIDQLIEAYSVPKVTQVYGIPTYSEQHDWTEKFNKTLGFDLGSILRHYNNSTGTPIAVIAGSYAIQHILDESYDGSDVDIFTSAANAVKSALSPHIKGGIGGWTIRSKTAAQYYKQLVERHKLPKGERRRIGKQIGKKMGNGPVDSEVVGHEYRDKHILSVWDAESVYTGHRIQIIETICVRRSLKSFDSDTCMTGFDGYNTFIKAPQDLLNKVVRTSNMNMARREKYEKRGFHIIDLL